MKVARILPFSGKTISGIVLLTLAACDGSIHDPNAGPWVPEMEALEVDPEASCDPERAELGTALPSQRITRRQYANAVRDLFALPAPWGGIDAWSDGPMELENGDPAPRRFEYVPTAGDANRTAIERLRSAAESIANEQAPRFREWGPCAEESTDCARQTIAQLGRLSWRHTLSEEESSALMGLYMSGARPELATPGLSAFQSGISLVISALLQSPDFLYRAIEAEDSDERTLRDGQEMAEALSFFLWGSLPDAALLDAAESGELDSPEGIAAQARRMLDDGRALEPVVDFYARWLHVEGLDHLSRDSSEYPAFYPELGSEMAASFRSFIEHVYTEGDRSLNTLMTARYAFMTPELANYLGMTPPPSGGNGRVELGETRRGLLTHPAFLTSNATNLVDDPIYRGLRIYERVLCLPIGGPPPNAGGERNPSEDEGPITTREHITNVTQSASGCANCHDRFNPLGYALGNFDATGRYNENQRGLPIDATGIIDGASDADGAFENGGEMIDRIAASDRLRACFAQSLLVEALRRVPNTGDACSLDSIREQLAVEDDLRELMVNVTTSDAFRFRAPTPFACAPETTEGDES